MDVFEQLPWMYMRMSRSASLAVSKTAVFRFPVVLLRVGIRKKLVIFVVLNFEQDPRPELTHFISKTVGVFQISDDFLFFKFRSTERLPKRYLLATFCILQ